MKLAYERVETPIGALDLVVGDPDVCLFEFARGRRRVEQRLAARFPDAELLDAVNPLGYTDRIRAYFEGELAAAALCSASRSRCGVWIHGLP